MTQAATIEHAIALGGLKVSLSVEVHPEAAGVEETLLQSPRDVSGIGNEALEEVCWRPQLSDLMHKTLCRVHQELLVNLAEYRGDRLIEKRS